MAGPTPEVEPQEQPDVGGQLQQFSHHTQTRDMRDVMRKNAQQQQQQIILMAV